VDDPALNDESRLVSGTGPLTPDEARRLLDRGAELIAGGDFAEAFRHYRRVVGFDDPAVTSAALLGAGQALYRLDDEAAAVSTWESILQLPETPATYHAWREIAAARVRDHDLQGAIAAYREADRRAPPQDKAEIANRLGWLAKETGNVRASRRYFARGRGSVLPIATYAILGVTVIVSLTALLAEQGAEIDQALALIKPWAADGQYWRFWTVTLVHADFLHLAFNMYALFLVGPLTEQIYGSVKMVVVYLVAALGGSVASFAWSDGLVVVGASGAIFGLFGILFAASRMHLPMLDRRSRNVLSQVGALIVLNIIIGFTSPAIDNIAHLGGLVAGLLMGIALVPGNVQTLASRWQPGTSRPVAQRFIGSPAATVLALVALAVGILVAIVVGMDRWGNVTIP
jgi:membrane associated rhomboid family serine protease